MQKTHLLIILSLGMAACSSSGEEGRPAAHPPLFTLLPATHTQIDFANNLTEGLNTNVLMYEYFYNGGGVAVGDINGDGLDDLYFSANMTPHKLYLNKGDMKTEDITETSVDVVMEGSCKTE